MRKSIMLEIGEDGKAREIKYDDRYDITIHCQNHEEHEKVLSLLRRAREMKWIPTAERMPEERENVLFCDSEKNVYLGHWVNDFSGRYAYWYAEGQMAKIENVIACMHLPDPYKESEEKNEDKNNGDRD